MRILIVDDDRGTVHFLQDFLAGKGHEVDVAYDGRTAVELMETGQYDIVFMDNRIPDISGENLIEHQRQHERNAVKMVMMTGYPDTTESDALAAGADYFLRKPFHLMNIECILACLMKEKSTR